MLDSAPGPDRDIVDKYYCLHCEEYVFGMSPQILANRLNSHNRVKHPFEFANWNDITVVHSKQYSGPNIPENSGRTWTLPDTQEPPKRELVTSDKMIVHPTLSSMSWGDAKKPPIVTEADKIFLRGGLIRWD